MEPIAINGRVRVHMVTFKIWHGNNEPLKLKSDENESRWNIKITLSFIYMKYI